MEGFNQVTLIGTVGKDAETKIFADDKKVANFSLATNRSYKSGNEKKNTTEWHNVEVWGEQAVFAGNYIKKGKHLLVQGELRTETYENKEGQKITRYKIAARTLQLLGGGKPAENNSQGANGNATASAAVPAEQAAAQVNSYVGSEAFADTPDDLPF